MNFSKQLILLLIFITNRSSLDQLRFDNKQIHGSQNTRIRSRTANYREKGTNKKQRVFAIRNLTLSSLLSLVQPTLFFERQFRISRVADYSLCPACHALQPEAVL